MKNAFLTVCALFVVMICMGCTATQLLAITGPQTGYGYTDPSMNPIYGYEKFNWGTGYETVKRETGWDITKSRTQAGAYFIGVYDKGWGIHNYYECYFPHGDNDVYVNKTWLYFNRDRLYAAEDEFKKTPSMEFLHNRYGEFPEENVVTSQQLADGIETVYRGQNYLDAGDFYALEIIISEKGKTNVKLREPFFEKSMAEKNQLGLWSCYSSIDRNYSKITKSSVERINFTFLNKNKDGKYLFVGYSKGYGDSTISYVRAGICWGDSASGDYDIAGDGSALSKSYSTEKWNCSYDGAEYAYTAIAGESARDILELFWKSEKVMVRHDGVISEFLCNGEQLQDKMAEYGITWEEIDEALLNEEF